MSNRTKPSDELTAMVELEATEHKFTKEQWLTSKHFTDSAQDLINTLLEDGESYTISEVQQKFEEFKAKEAK